MKRDRTPAAPVRAALLALAVALLAGIRPAWGQEPQEPDTLLVEVRLEGGERVIVIARGLADAEEIRLPARPVFELFGLGEPPVAEVTPEDLERMLGVDAVWVPSQLLVVVRDPRETLPATHRRLDEARARAQLVSAIEPEQRRTGPFLALTADDRGENLSELGYSADRLGVPLVGPPEHPFNSLAALRTLGVFQDDPRALGLAFRLSSLCWGEGQPLTHPKTLIAAVDEFGLMTEGLAGRIASTEIKERLRANTEEALDAGVFGVPTFVWEGELFWGHDRMAHLADRLEGRLGSPKKRGADLAARPRGAERPSVAARWARPG